MISTPIYDFVKKYAEQRNVRFHMPGHKGTGALGCENFDITEISGADSLFEADGIIAESENNLSYIYGTRASFYSAEGSSLCIRAMVYLAMKYSGGKKKILAGRNAHKSFLSALSLCDADADWLYGENLYSCEITPDSLDKALGSGEYLAVYITNPDYLGNMVHIKSIADVCHKHNTPLLVDNAHGAYLKFTGQHPMDNGADMCCDSAHKTFSCLTGAAYLHVSRTALFPYENDVKSAMSLFASTSPSYLIMASMDLMNREMNEGYGERIRHTSMFCSELKTSLSHFGLDLSGRESLKVNVRPKSFGYTGNEISCLAEREGIYPEFADKDNLVFMFTPNNTDEDFERITRFFGGLKRKPPVNEAPPVLPRLAKVMTPRQAMFSCSEQIPVKNAAGRILSSPCVSCPPAIPIAVCGEVMDENAVGCFEYYGTEYVKVVK